MTTYYYELKNGFGKFKAMNDHAAKCYVGVHYPGHLICYREDQTSKDGTPFVVISEKREN